MNAAIFPCTNFVRHKVLDFILIQWIALVCLPFSGSAQQASSTNRFELSDVIPSGKIMVQVLDIRFSKRVEELSLKWMSAVATNQDWWMDYVKKHADEHPLPYHANFGISEAEYREYLDGADKTRHFEKVADAYLIFKYSGDVLSIDLGDTNSPVEKWQLNVSTGDLITPAGDLGKPEWKASEDTTQPLGAYEGYAWRFEKDDPALSNIQTTSLWIYRLRANGMIFWRIKDGEMRNDRSVRSLDLQFRYNLRNGHQNGHQTS